MEQHIAEQNAADFRRRAAAKLLDSASPSSAEEGAEERLQQCYRGTRVLLVEDEPISREVAQMLLEGAGLETDIAANGRVAGMNDFNAKPVQPDRLFQILLKWLRRPQDSALTLGAEPITEVQP